MWGPGVPPWVDGALPLPDGEGARRPGVACWPLAVLGTSGAGWALSSDPGELVPGAFLCISPSGAPGERPTEEAPPTAHEERPQGLQRVPGHAPCAVSSLLGCLSSDVDVSPVRAM